MSSTLTHTLLILVHIKLILFYGLQFLRLTLLLELHQISLPLASASPMSEYTVQLMKNKLTHPWGGFAISTTVQ